MTAQDLIDHMTKIAFNEELGLDDIQVVCEGPRDREPDPRIYVPPDWESYPGERIIQL